MIYKLALVILMVTKAQKSSGIACDDALGVESNKASILANAAHGYADRGRLNYKFHSGGWCTSISDEIFLEVNLKSEKYITSVATQGAKNWAGQVLKYLLAFSTDGTEWWDYMEDGEVKIFSGNTGNRDDIVRNNLSAPVRAQLVRFKPKLSLVQTCMRVEVYGCEGCADPLGIEDGRIQDSNITASSSNGSGFEAYRGRLNNLDGRGSWCSLKKNRYQHLRIDLGKPRTVTGIQTQGNPFPDVYPYDARVPVNCSDIPTPSYSVNSTNTSTHSNGSQPENLNANITSEPNVTANWSMNQTMNNTNKGNITANYTIVHADITSQTNQTFNTTQANLTEHYSTAFTNITNHANLTYITNQTSTIANHSTLLTNITSHRDNNTKTNFTNSSNFTSDYLETNLTNQENTTGSNYTSPNTAPLLCNITVRKYASAWVRYYSLDYSLDGKTWKSYGEQAVTKRFDGNTNSNSSVHRQLVTRLTARYISIKPESWKNTICMRVEIKGCEACTRELGVSHGRIPNERLAASSYLANGFQSRYARLKNPTRIWCADRGDTAPFLQVDLWNTHRVRFLATQGGTVNGTDVWISTYTMQFSTDGEEWFNYTESGTTKLFSGNSDSRTVRKITLLDPIVAVFVRIRPHTWTGHVAACLRVELYGCKVCSGPLGMESGEIKNENIISDHYHGRYEYYRARLNYRGSWELSQSIGKKRRMFLRVDLGPSGAVVSGIATQSSLNRNYWVTQYTLSYSEDKVHWTQYTENGMKQFFQGNNDTLTTVRHNFRTNVTARYVELEVIHGTGGRMGMRMELYGCKICERPLGIESGSIPDTSMKASSHSTSSTQAWNGRLHGPTGWCTNNIVSLRDYLQIDLQRVHSITAIAVQGLHQYNHYIFYGPDNNAIPKVARPGRPITARFVRLWPRVWMHRICMRVELYGGEAPSCSSPLDTGVSNPLGLTSGRIPSPSIIATSFFGPEYLPRYGRLGTNLGNGAWCTAIQDKKQFLQVDLGVPHRIMGFSTQGKHRLSTDQLGAAWVTSYTVSCSKDGGNWDDILENNISKVFRGNDESNITVKHVLQDPVITRFIRFNPLTWMSTICMRVEIFGCKECSSPLGVENLKIPNGAMKAYSWSGGAEPYRSRLNYRGQRWYAPYIDLPAFFHIYLGPEMKKVSGVATEGSHSGWVEAYVVAYSYKEANWINYMENGEVKVFEGNSGCYTVVKHEFQYSFRARYFKMNIKKVYYAINMRMELYGCKDCSQRVGLQSNTSFPDSNFRASSSDTAGEHHPYTARLGTKVHGGAWCPARRANSEYLQIDLGKNYLVSQVALQGNEADNEWTTTVTIAYMNDDIHWWTYRDINYNAKIAANIDSTSVKRLYFKFPFYARHMKLNSYTWNKRGCIRVEIYSGCKGCVDEIPQYQETLKTNGMQASSYFGPRFEPFLGSMRVGGDHRGWCAGSNNESQFLQFNYKVTYKVTGVTTTGPTVTPYDGNASWIHQYWIEYSMDGHSWMNYTEKGDLKIFTGNSNEKTVRFTALRETPVARFVRLVPMHWSNWICLRAMLHGCAECCSPLGVETRRITNMKGSHHHLHHDPARARLHDSNGFTVRYASRDMPPYLQINVGNFRKIITAVAVQPDYIWNTYVWSYYISYSPTGEDWVYYVENGIRRTFNGYRDRETAVKAAFVQPINARLIRFNPISWRYRPGLRVELYGCIGCERPLGMQSGAISNSSITASSYKVGFEPWRARLGASDIWCAGSYTHTSHNYVQVDMLVLTEVTGVELEGDKNSNKRTRRFFVSYSVDGVWWKFYSSGVVAQRLNGNYNNGIATRVNFRSGLLVRVIRINPNYWYTDICMKIEIRGCTAVDSCQGLLGMETSLITNDSLSATSSLGPDFQPWFARLNTNMGGGGWCAGENNASEYLQVNLKIQHKITRVILQGRGGETTEGQAWVSKYSLEYSVDGVRWTTHSENGTEMFSGCSQESQVKETVLLNPLHAMIIRIRPRQWHNQICMRVEFRGCKVIGKALGMETLAIENNRLSSSSSSRYNYPYKGRLYYVDRWRPQHNTDDEYLQISFEPYGKTVSAIATQGYIEWITLYTLSFSMDGKCWYDYIEDGEVRMFTGNEDAYKVKRHGLSRNLTASHIRFHPKQWYSLPSLRVELYGYEGCDSPIGISNLPNSSFKASSYREGKEPWHARLGSSVGSWCSVSGSNSEYLQIDLGDVYIISFIATEGDRVTNSWMTSYKLEYKEEENGSWNRYVYYRNDGPHDGADPRVPRLKAKTFTKLQARFVRMYPVAYLTLPCVRFEMYGCLAGGMEIGMTSYMIRDEAITASSFDGPYTKPEMARLNSKRGDGAWCAYVNDTSPFLQVDLGWLHNVRYISIQGQYGNREAWVEKFMVSYREEGQDWRNITEGNTVKAFSGNNNSFSSVKQPLNVTTRARFIRLHPIKWRQRACLRAEVYGSRIYRNDGSYPLGMNNRIIPDSNITASFWHTSHPPRNARLLHNSAWYTQYSGRKNFLMVDLGLQGAVITAVASQGGSFNAHIVREYSLVFSIDGTTWVYYMENGRTKIFTANRQYDEATPVTNILDKGVRTRYVKFKVESRVIIYNLWHVGMRVEVYGYYMCNETCSLLSKFSNSQYSNVGYVVTTSSNLARDPSQNASQAMNISWCAEFNDTMQYLQIDFVREVRVTGVSIEYQGSQDLGFALLFATHGQSVREYGGHNGTTMVFNTGKHMLYKQFTAQRIKIKPSSSWQDYICVEVDVYGCDASLPLGMESWRIKDNAVTASSHYQLSTRPSLARLDQETVYRAWCAGVNDLHQYLAIDLGYVHHVTHITTQGRHSTGMESWVSEYYISFREDGTNWDWYTINNLVKALKGNQNSYHVVKQTLSPPIRARHVRIHPRSWNGAICMRVELFGNPVCASPLGINYGVIPDSAMESMNSSACLQTEYPWYGRLHRVMGNGGWCAPSNDPQKYLQIDLGEPFVVSGVSTQGRHLGYQEFLTSYSLSYSLDGVSWMNYTENKTTKILTGNVDQHEVSTHMLNSNITARYVRFIVNTWNGRPCLRVELLGCQVPVIDGGYSNFTDWTGCPVTCGGGTRLRTRNCSNPEPRNNGKNCTQLGPDIEVRRCNSHLCPAPNITFPSFVPTSQPVDLTMTPCITTTNRSFDFGDCTNAVNTTQCVVRHIYRKSGIYSIRITQDKHLTFLWTIYVQDSVTGLRFVNSSRAMLVGRNFNLFWSIDLGTMPFMVFNYGDNSPIINFTLGETLSGRPYRDIASHIYTNAGVYTIRLSASNYISNKTVTETAIIEVHISIRSITVQNVGKFDRIYQLDKFRVDVDLNGGTNPRYNFIFGNGMIFNNLEYSKMVYAYPEPGVYNLTVEVFNNASRVNISTTVLAHKIIPITDINLTIPPNAFSDHSIAYINLSAANPYECVWNFGDGNFTTVSSLQNMSVMLHRYKVGVHTVIVTCSNHLSSKMINAVAITQKKIVGLAFTSNSPREVNETMTFKIMASEIGTNSCYVATLGDGTIHAFGKQHCLARYSLLTFLDLTNASYTFGNIYWVLKVYTTTLKAWNLVSEFSFSGHAVALKIPCNYPNTTIVNIATTADSPTIMTRLRTMVFETMTKIDCKATNLKDVFWSVFKLSSQKQIVGKPQSLGNWERTTVLPKTLDYGLYLLRFNVSMRGQEGVYSYNDGYLTMIPTPLVAVIDGGKHIERGYDTQVSFDASRSYDPDYSDTTGFGYYWFCYNKSERVSTDINVLTTGLSIETSPPYSKERFCNSSLPYRLLKAGSSIPMFTGRLVMNETYVILLVFTRTIHGETRRTVASQTMKVVQGNPPSLSTKCISNCKSTVSPSDKLTIEGSCVEETSEKKVLYVWQLYEESSSTRQKRSVNPQTGSLKRIIDLNNLTSTGTFQRFLVIRANTLIGGHKYRLVLTGTMYGRSPGRADYTFTVNKPPEGGQCSVDKRTGYADSTNFTFTCWGWIDDELPLTYEYNYRSSYGLATLIYYGPKNTVKTKLPVGDPSKNYTTYFYVKIVDSLGALETFTVKVQVLIPPGNKQELHNKFHKLFTGEDSKLDEMMSQGKVQEVAQEVNSITSILNAYSTEEGKNASEEDRSSRQKMRTAIVKMFVNKKPTTLSAIKQIGPVMAQATLIKEEVPVETQKLALNAFQDMGALMESKLHDPETTSTNLEDVGVIIVFGVGNVIRAAGDSARVYGDPSAKDTTTDVTAMRTKAKEISKNATAVVNKVADFLLSTRVAGEDALVIKPPSMTIALQRKFPDTIGDKPIDDGEASVGLPPANSILDNFTLYQTKHIDMQLMRFDDNPFTWDKSGESIKSSVISLNLKNANKNILNVSGLSSDINLYIPRTIPKAARDQTDKLFVSKRNGSMRFHKYTIELEELPMNIRISAVKDSIFEVYIKMEKRPTIRIDKPFTRLPDYSSCTSSSTSVGNSTSKNRVCLRDPYTIFIDKTLVTQSGTYFLCVRHLLPPAKHPNRVRRDCGGGPREKRSCLQYKDPPPKPTTEPLLAGNKLVTVIPKYDEKRDLVYTVETFRSACKYWDAKREIWTSEGCKVGSNTRLDKIHCLCNHLTAFGGGLLVVPNPIDFDQVWAGFKNIADNLAVVLTIATGFGLYILLALCTRRMDKRDIAMVGTTIIETETPFGEVGYAVTVQTGSWQGSSTTANVFMNIFGETGQTGRLSLKDNTKRLFSQGATNTFLVPLQESLGSLLYLRVWHDMSGLDSSWYLNYVIIRDLSSDAQWIFVCDRWLALEKDDGLIDRLLLVSSDRDLKNFKTLFRTKISQDLFDGHLWMSVVKKPPNSYFSRLQRLSCCMSLLFTTMMTSAMFYNFGNKTDTSTISLGPLRFSVRQLVIGIQSSLIALPGNMIVVQLFRNGKPRTRQEEEEESKQTTKSKEESNRGAKRRCCPATIPYWCIYIAWVLCFGMTLTSATITLFYSMMWGKEISNEWLTSMLVSFFQDAFVTQPIKVCFIALFVAAVLKTLPKDFTEFKKQKANQDTSNASAQSFEKGSDDTLSYESPDRKLIERARKFKLKESKMFGIIKENVFHLVFLALLVVISCTARDPMAYQQMKALKDATAYQVKDANSFWTFLHKRILPFTFNQMGYNGLRKPVEGGTADLNLFVVGMPRIRQLRVKTEPCDLNLTLEVCVSSYSAFNEEKSFYLPGWRKMANLTYKECPIPWRYKDFLELNGLPFWGHQSLYGGGGYTADLGYNIEQANSTIEHLRNNNWIDVQTRAIFSEFTVYNAHSNLFSVVTFLVESQGTGGSTSFLRIDTFRLYQHAGASQSVIIACELIVVVITLVLAYITIKKIYHLRMSYFKETWNVVQLVVILLSISAVALFIVRLFDTKRTIRKLQENPFVFISFQYASQWAEVNTYVISMVVFLSTLKFLYLMSFNRNITVLYETVARSLKSLALLAVEALILFGAFAIFSFLVFGSQTDGFVTFIQTIETLLAMILGKAYYEKLSSVDRILGPLFFSLFAISMLFLLLNMFMAIIMDNYQIVKEEYSGDLTEFEMAAFMIERFKVFIGAGTPPPDPWRNDIKLLPVSARRYKLDEMKLAEEKRQRRLTKRNILDLPHKAVSVQRVLRHINDAVDDNSIQALSLAAVLMSRHSSNRLNMGPRETFMIECYLCDED